MFKLLDHLQPTATGLDLVPAGFLRLTASVIAAPIAELYNQSIARVVVPIKWKKAFIAPVLKKWNPTAPEDYRPISITPILSQTLEKHVVRKYLYPGLIRLVSRSLLDLEKALLSLTYTLLGQPGRPPLLSSPCYTLSMTCCRLMNSYEVYAGFQQDL